MPRYVFHVQDGRDVADAMGTVLDDAEAPASRRWPSRAR